MYVGVAVVFGALMLGGLTLGVLLAAVGPRDEEAAEMYRRQAGRGRTWVTRRLGARAGVPEAGS